jgi:hypothetical protein
VTSNQPLITRTTCEALVITCSDFRFKSAERAFLEASGLTDDYDLIARPGAARPLVAPRSPAAADTLRDEIALLWSVHHFPRILLVNHMSCRAYDDIASPENEREVHAGHLRRAVQVIADAYEGVSAEPYLVVIGDSGLSVQPLSTD